MTANWAASALSVPSWAEFRRVLAPGGLMVLMTSESHLMREALEHHEIALNSMLAVTILGASAWIYVCRVMH